MDLPFLSTAEEDAVFWRITDWLNEESVDDRPKNQCFLFMTILLVVVGLKGALEVILNRYVAKMGSKRISHGLIRSLSISLHTICKPYSKRWFLTRLNGKPAMLEEARRETRSHFLSSPLLYRLPRQIQNAKTGEMQTRIRMGRSKRKKFLNTEIVTRMKSTHPHLQLALRTDYSLLRRSPNRTLPSWVKKGSILKDNQSNRNFPFYRL